MAQGGGRYNDKPTGVRCAGEGAGLLYGIVHIELIAKNGIFLHENLDLAELVQDRAYEFAYIFVPVPLKGATGSPGSPIAVR
jgi:hypothetical protein